MSTDGHVQEEQLAQRIHAMLVRERVGGAVAAGSGRGVPDCDASADHSRALAQADARLV